MTVKQLINKLNKMPADSKVTFVNSDTYINGIYEVDKVEDWLDGTVLLDSEHEKLFDEE